MVLVDTSVWIRHFRTADVDLQNLLLAGEVVCHPFITGELACGGLRNRREILDLLHELPQAIVAEHGEVLSFLEARRLVDRGIGLVDVHLLASAILGGFPIWTRDRRLREAAIDIGISFD
ncbi:MAG: type II toxin-antitoxin system VapC family toxin [Kiritimatiellaeota bacterium]|nr:type II toxin-antitoxin system VapC family toxin [Kiritimatiellota bacterium]